MSRHNRRDELIKELGYCECKWASPSSHHDCCINEECGKVIKTTGERLAETKAFIDSLSDPYYIGSNEPGYIVQCWKDGRKIVGTFINRQFQPKEP